MTLDALVFDFDGLILDTEVPEYLTIRAEFEAHGVELPLDQWLEVIGRADNRSWLDWLEEAVGRPIEREVVRARRVAQHHELVMANEVLPGVAALLDEADARGVPAAVASSSSRSWVAGHLERLGLLDRFATVRTIDDVARGKPWPDLFLAAVEALGGDPRRSVAFEDSHNGSRAATAAGLYCVVAPNEMTRGQDFSHADLVVPSLTDVHLADLERRIAARAA
jgi:HAD superfamily hydrolase (TIGR01509 family)